MRAVDIDRLKAQVQNPAIKKLTDDELIVVDPDGIQEDFRREKPKK